MPLVVDRNFAALGIMKRIPFRSYHLRIPVRNNGTFKEVLTGGGVCDVMNFDEVEIKKYPITSRRPAFVDGRAESAQDIIYEGYVYMVVKGKKYLHLLEDFQFIAETDLCCDLDD